MNFFKNLIKALEMTKRLKRTKIKVDEEKRKEDELFIYFLIFNLNQKNIEL